MTMPTGSVETSGVFDPATDGIDFYESLEGMRVQINNAVAVGPRSDQGEIPVLSDDGANASVRTTRGGIVVRATDFNPERIFLDDLILATPVVHVGDHFSGPADRCDGLQLWKFQAPHHPGAHSGPGRLSSGNYRHSNCHSARHRHLQR